MLFEQKYSIIELKNCFYIQFRLLFACARYLILYRMYRAEHFTITRWRLTDSYKQGLLKHGLFQLETNWNGVSKCDYLTAYPAWFPLRHQLDNTQSLFVKRIIKSAHDLYIRQTSIRLN